ncbi:permease [Cytobacillus kochii]|uniref:permease n=1 Tax=Cytobacillus kochii TaxID=859143 RepID=UPI00402A992A
MEGSRKIFIVIGSFYLIISLFLLTVSILAKALTMTFLMPLAMAIMCYCLGYLYPEWKQKDERMRLIRTKGLSASFFALLLYYFVFSGLLQFSVISITAMQLLNLLGALMIITVFLSFVIFAKIY